MQTDEQLTYAGRVITARDIPRGEFGVYRHYEVDGNLFESLEAAKAYADGQVAPVVVPVPDVSPEPESTATVSETENATVSG